MRQPLIACLTDFGTADPFAGILKAVALGLAPATRWVDLTHGIPAGDVQQAALAAWQSAPFLPEGSILLTVVDPGVGSSRRAIAVAWDRLRAVGPDNGSFSYLAMATPPVQAVEIRPECVEAPRPISSTFHGRDLFAVAAARLAAGVALEALGDPVSNLTLLPPPTFEVDASQCTVTGEVIHFDHFGNAVTSIGTLRRVEDRLALDPWLRQGPPLSLPADGAFLIAGNLGIPLRATYADAPHGSPLAYIGSSGLLEVAIRDGRADAVLGLRLDDRLQLCYKG
jgi:S-adenosylmethionine hydrolase